MKRSLVLALSVVLAACSETTAPVASSAPQSRAALTADETIQDISFSLTACNGEEVDFTGDYRIHQVASQNTQKTMTDFHAAGTGLVTGANYIAHFKTSNFSNTNSTTFHYSLSVTGGGSHPFDIDIFAHAVGANGMMVDRVEVGC